MVLAVCQKVEYEAGEFQLAPSFSRDPRVFYPHKDECGMTWEDRGTGWAQGVSTSKLILFAEVDGMKREIWVDRFFKNRLGRLTKKRRAAIQAAMPQSMEVRERVGRKGTKYFVPVDAEMENWLTRTAGLL